MVGYRPATGQVKPGRAFLTCLSASEWASARLLAVVVWAVKGKPMTRITLQVEVTGVQVIDAVADVINNNPHFNYRYFSIWQAERLEAAARLIREGYKREPKEKDSKTM